MELVAVIDRLAREPPLSNILNGQRRDSTCSKLRIFVRARPTIYLFNQRGKSFDNSVTCFLTLHFTCTRRRIECAIKR